MTLRKFICDVMIGVHSGRREVHEKAEEKWRARYPLPRCVAVYRVRDQRGEWHAHQCDLTEWHRGNHRSDLDPPHEDYFEWKYGEGYAEYVRGV